MTNPEVQEASQVGQDSELEHAMKTLRKPRQVAPANEAALKKARAKTRKDKAKKPKTQNVVMTLEDDADDEVLSKIDLTAQLTVMETKFLELKFAGGLSTDRAMIAAGYGDYSQNHRYWLAKKIIEKYESSGGDHRKIFRDIGAGETAVAEGLLKLATTAKSEMVRLSAWQTIAKCLGLQKETVDIQHGISIIIQRSETPPPVPGAGNRKPALGFTDKGELPGPTPMVITS